MTVPLGDMPPDPLPGLSPGFEHMRARAFTAATIARELYDDLKIVSTPEHHLRRHRILVESTTEVAESFGIQLERFNP